MPLSNVSAQEGCFDYLSKNNNLIRVGISNNNFSKLEYNSIDIGATGIYKVIDKTSGKLLTELEPSQIINITISNSKFTVKANDTVLVDMVAGPLIIKTDANSKLKVAGLYRGGKPALYRGIFEIARTPNSTGRFSLINVLPLEEYLRGVVPNEIPVYFGIEAVKAQAIAARNYAVRPRTRTYNNFDVCDSVASQVYFGANTETTISDRAIEETEGLYSLYDGEIILALYSSTAGGYTESYENAFTQPGSTVFPSTPKPYLKGKPDIPGTPPLYDEAAAEAFYTSKPQSFDINSSYYRWTKKWTREELENTLKQTLPTVSNTGMLLPSFRTGQNLGTLKELRVVSRGVSGKAMLVEIITDQGSWVIKKELIIRQVLKHQGKMLPSANIIIKNKYDELGNLVEVVVHGGGFGHGVGMSQFGAGYMSKHNYTFDQILQHYYDNTAIEQNLSYYLQK